MKTISELKNFLILWLSQSASSLGTAMTEYALTVWVYSLKGTAMSLTMLTLCTFMPTILLRFVAGALADRWDKKRIMLISDAVAALGTLTILVLHRASYLEIWHLYVINFLLSCMNAFQIPASYVATSLVVPKSHYAKAGGLQSASGAVISIAAPALGSLIYAAAGLGAVLIIDLATFAIALSSLLFLVRIPAAPRAELQKMTFIQDCLFGFRWLKDHASLLKLCLFIAAINFLAKLGSDGMLAAFVLGRTGSQQTLAAVQASVSVGLLTGSALTALAKPPKRRTRAIFLLCGLTFLAGNALMPLLPSPFLWCPAIFASYTCASAMGVHLGTVMRTAIPIPVQGRVSSAVSTLQNCSIPLGLYLGGILADKIFTPFITVRPNPLFPTGLSLMFFIIGLLGASLCLACFMKNSLHDLNTTE